jgi:hypothetical protein
MNTGYEGAYMNLIFLNKKIILLIMTLSLISSPLLPMEQDAAQSGFSQSQFTSPKKITTQLKNYCKEITNILCEQNQNATRNDRMIKIITQFFNKANNYASHIKKSVSNPTPFFCSIFLALFNSLSETFDHPNTAPDIFQLKQDDDYKNIIYMPIRTPSGQVFVFEFQWYNSNSDEDTLLATSYACEMDTQEDIQIINLRYDEADKIMQPFAVSIRNNNPNAQAITIEPKNITPYNEENFYKHIIIRFNTANHTDEDRHDFTRRLSTIYNAIPLRWHINREKYYQAILHWILLFFGNAITTSEKVSGSGRIDIAVSTEKYVNVVEFKRNSSTKKAIDQIYARRYFDGLSEDNKTNQLFGININTKNTNNIPCIVSTEIQLYDPQKVPTATSLQNTHIQALSGQFFSEIIGIPLASNQSDSETALEHKKRRQSNP